MADATVSRLGQANGAGDANALFLQVFAGEVMAAFERENVMLNRHIVRTIKSGKSAQFPATWRNTATYHTPGSEIVGKVVGHNERIITIDDLLISDVFIANIDEAKNHYDVRSIYTTECGAALARTWDTNVQQVAVLAARASATVAGAYGGSSLIDADFATSSDSMIGTAFDVAKTFDEKDVPARDRYLVLKPAQYYLLTQNTKVISKDYAERPGDIGKGKVFELAGLELVKSNHVPSTVVNTGPAAYQGDFSTTVAFGMQKMAVGTVKLLDLAIESAYDIRRQGTLIVAKYAVGHGILRPECAVEIKSA